MIALLRAVAEGQCVEAVLVVGLHVQELLTAKQRHTCSSITCGRTRQQLTAPDPHPAGRL